MNDNDIIKALECCVVGFCYAGSGCPLGHIGDGDACITELCKTALDLINCQKAEIEKLRESRVSIAQKYYNHGIRDFADKLKDVLDDPRTFGGLSVDIIMDRINDLVKEMTEEQK